MRRDIPIRPVLPVAVVPVGWVAGVVAVVRLALAAVPRSRLDEDLVLTAGRHHLDIGAVDQPPLTPLLARLADTLAPGSQLVLAAPIAPTDGSRPRPRTSTRCSSSGTPTGSSPASRPRVHCRP